ncbi:SDR family NAD(P)-dependent oxidoreductase [Pseudonocardia sulfidoxydans]
MTRRLKKRVALVTGGSRGVGRGIAARLASEGAAVALTYHRNADAAVDAVADIESAGGAARSYPCAMTDSESIALLVDSVRGDMGQVDLFVSNAGHASRGRAVIDTEAAEYLELLQVHVLGPLELLRLVLPDLRQADRADIIVVSSVLTGQHAPNTAPYTIAKSGMEAAARVLAKEERQYGVRVNIVAPGLVATDMGERLVTAAHGSSISEVGSAFPFGRVAYPADIASAVAYLASAEGEYITGQRIEIDGGGQPNLFG